MKKAHPGFAAVQKKIAAKQGVSMERAGAIVAAGARKASKKAVAANPRLKRVSGVVEKKTGETYKSPAAKRKHEGKESPVKKRSELKRGK